MVSVIIIPLFAVGVIAANWYTDVRPSDKVVILVAEFDGPDPLQYRVTEAVLTSLRSALEQYGDVQVEALGRTVKETDGRSLAQSEGRDRKANIVIWGWYGATGETVPVSVHFELLDPSFNTITLCPAAKGKIRTFAQEELMSFSLQIELSNEISYMGLIVAGMTRFLTEDWQGTIDRLNEAQDLVLERLDFTPPSEIYLFRGFAYAAQGKYSQAILDYDQSISLNPSSAKAYFHKAGSHLELEELDSAIAAYTQFITRAYYSETESMNISEDDQTVQGDDTPSPHFLSLRVFDGNLPCAYNNRGTAYLAKGLHEQAMADFERAHDLDPDLVYAILNRAQSYSQLENYDSAVTEFTQFISEYPHAAEAYYGRGLAYYHLGNYEQAVDDLTTAINGEQAFTKTDPVLFKADSYKWRGYIHTFLGDNLKAKADYLKVLEISNDPDQRRFAEEELRGLGIEVDATKSGSQ